MTDSIRPPHERRLRPLRAFAAGCFGIGVGYLYVNRPRGALLVLAVLVVVPGLLAASRLIVTPAGFYAFMASILAAALVNAIPPAAIARTERSARRQWYNRWWIYLSIWLGPGIAVALAGGYDDFREHVMGYATFRTASVAMSPTLEPNDFFVVDAWQYHRVAPAVGDVIAFVPPRNPAVTYVKRVVGLPGDVVEIRDSIAYRNGAPLHEAYVHAATDQHPYGRDVPPVRVGADEYYVLGDFRDNSQDSRNFGPVARAAIIGPAKFVWFSFGHGNAPAGRYPRAIGAAPARG